MTISPEPAAAGGLAGPSQGRIRPFHAVPLLSHRITPRTILRVLSGGFALVLILMIAASLLQSRHTSFIEASVDQLVQEQLAMARLINEIQDEQGTLNEVFYQLSNAKAVDRAALLAQLDETDRDVARITSTAANTPEAELWGKVSDTTRAFSGEARRLIEAGTLSPRGYRALFQHHEQVIGLIAQLVAAGSARAQMAKRQISLQSQAARYDSVALTAACFLLALFCAALTIWLAWAAFRRMEAQSEELNRVTWHMLEGQEITARRFSHELHDELGQSLTGVRANLVALRPDNLDVRRADCLQLLEESIQNVRELSQLLRPVILDDFGLDASLNWLATRFTQRTGIPVRYESDFQGRLVEDTETHLYRIAQEALTNAARHSGASEIRLDLHCERGRVRLRIRDNGKGVPRGQTGQKGLGIVGMRARAHHAGGELAFHTGRSGVSVEAWVPAREEEEPLHPGETKA